MLINQRTKFFDVLLILSSIAFIYIGVYQLFFAKSLSISQRDLPVLGEIFDYHNDVRLKKSHLFSWSRVQSDKTSLQEGDYIFTNKDSSVEVLFGSKKESKLKVTDSALIKIEDNKSINIENGNVEIYLTGNESPITLKLNKKKYIVKSKKASRFKILSTNNKIDVMAGEINVQNELEQVDIGKGQKLELSSDELRAEDSALNIIYPNNEVIITKQTRSKIKFNIEGLTSNHQIELSKRLSFKKYKKIGNTQALPAGNYFWRVKNIKTKKVSEVKNFKVVQEIKPPTLFSPKKEFELISYVLNPSLIFSWNQKLKTKNKSFYNFELYQIQDNGEKNIIFSEILQREQIKLKVKPSDTSYHWQVQYLDDKYFSPFSKASNFTVTSADFDKLKPNVIELKRPNQAVEFNWVKTKGKVKFELSEQPTFEKISKQEVLKSNKYKTSLSNLGTYYWRVRPTSKGDGNIKPVKVILKPIPAPVKPATPPELNIKIKKRSSFNKMPYLHKLLLSIFSPAQAKKKVAYEAELTIPKIENAKTYEIEIFKDSDLKEKIKVFKSKSNIIIWDNPPLKGQYFWRMRYTDYWDRTSPFSDISKVNVIPIKKRKRIKRAAKKKKKNKKRKISKKIVKKESSHNTNLVLTDSFSLLYAPSIMKYTKAQDVLPISMTIEGSAINSYTLNLLKNYQKSLFLGHFRSSVGEVFNGHDFNYKELSLAYSHKKALIKRNYYPLVLASIFSAPTYGTSGSIGTFESNSNIFKIGLGAMTQQKIGTFQAIQAKVETYFIKGFSYKFNLTYRYDWKNDFFLSTGASFNSIKLSVDDEEYKVKEFQILIGGGSYF